MAYVIEPLDNTVDTRDQGREQPKGQREGKRPQGQQGLPGTVSAGLHCYWRGVPPKKKTRTIFKKKKDSAYTEDNHIETAA